MPRLTISALIAFTFGWLVYLTHGDHSTWQQCSAAKAGAATGVSLAATSLMMIWSSLFGKLSVCREVVERLGIEGSERVLDVGCGSGLFLIECAKRLPTGVSIGVYAWVSRDQYGVTPERTVENAQREQVTQRIELITADARQLPLDTASIDIVVSNLLLHNLPGTAARREAILEWTRVLRPNGKLAIFDLAHVGEYERELAGAGFIDVQRIGRRVLFLPTAGGVIARKPLNAGNSKSAQ